VKSPNVLHRMTRRSASQSPIYRAPVIARPIGRLEPGAQIHALQRTAGNQATTRWLHAQVIQRTLSASTSEPPQVTPGLASYLDASRGAGQSLSGSVRRYFEPRFGSDFSAVRVHTDGRAARAAAEIRAKAFTTGTNIHFAAGAFHPGTSAGDRLLAHELTHVVQQSAAPMSGLQRQSDDSPVGPLPDPPGSDVDCNVNLAAGKKREFINCCTQTPLGRGCSEHVIKGVCKLIGCDPKPPKPISCPTGFKPGATRSHKGQCCRTSKTKTSEDPQSCCDRGQIADYSPSSARCCPAGTTPDAERKDCIIPPAPPVPLCLPSQTTVKGECCVPPMVPKGNRCVTAPPPPPTPTPTLASPSPVEIFFEKDKPSAKSTGAKALNDSLTAQGRVSFSELIVQLRDNPAVKVQLVGRTSPEHSEEYNLALGQRRAEMIAAAIEAEGIDSSRIANPPVAELRSECQDIRPGVVTCGEAGSTGPKDRQVLVRLFLPNP
jgi:Domain of unknown function (DUF4157)/OmpA family